MGRMDSPTAHEVHLNGGPVADSSPIARVELACHPETPGTAISGIAVAVRRSAGDTLKLSFRLTGELTRVDIPAPRPSRMGSRLWEHTCFEAFLAVDGAAAYHEVNLAPSGEWTVYAFSRYRDGGPLADTAAAPRIARRNGPGRLVLDAHLRLDRLSPAYRQAPLRLGIAAVIEDRDGTRSYWALHHPAGRPDFHHPDARTLLLEPPRCR